MAWCEPHRVDHLFGLARNARLAAAIEAETAAARAEAAASGKPARRFRDLACSTLDSRSRTRRVIGQAGWTGGESTPRLVVTSLRRAEAEARHLYETACCARGEMENRIKECQLDPFADRTSAATTRANQLRLWPACAAHVLMCARRRIGPAHTQFAAATCGTIRLRLLKVGPSACLPSGYAGRNLRQASPWRGSACDGSRWPWPPPAPGNTSGPSPTRGCGDPRSDRTNQTPRGATPPATPSHPRRRRCAPQTSGQPTCAALTHGKAAPHATQTYHTNSG